MKINCLHPITILNRAIFDVLTDVCSLVNADGDVRYISNHERMQILDGVSIYKVLRVFPVERSAAPPELMLVDSDGVSTPLFIQVPCGKCSCCAKSKEFSLTQRADFAFQESATPCFFVTLTYSPRWNKVIDKGVNIRHIQLFKKRFKRNLDLLGKDSSSVKFLVTSEYGKLGRPHYHMLVFGCPYLDDNHLKHDYLFRQLINFCWRVPERSSDGKFRSFSSYLSKFPKLWKRADDYDKLSYGYSQVSEIRGDGSSCASYACKYAFKDAGSTVPKGKNKLFRSVSKNLGFDFVLSRKDNILSDKESKFYYCDQRSNKLVSTFLSSYYVNKLFPSRSKLVPVELRKLLHSTYLEIGMILGASKYVSPHVLGVTLRDKRCLEAYFPWFKFSMPSHDYSSLDVLKRLDISLSVIRSNFKKLIDYVHLDYDDVCRRSFERDVFLSKFKERSLSSVMVSSRQWRRKNSDLRAKAIL